MLLRYHSSMACPSPSVQCWSLSSRMEQQPLDCQVHRRAVEGDDWSSVVDGQTAETVEPELVEAQLRAARNPIATPFARASVHRSIGAWRRCWRRRTASCPLPGLARVYIGFPSCVWVTLS